MKTKTLLLLAFAFLMGAASCGRDKSADAGAILQTIPSDASMVAVCNLESLLEKAGCKVSGTSVTPGGAASQITDSIENPRTRAFCSAVAGGTSGIDPSLLCLFTEGFNTYATGWLANTAQFKEKAAAAYEEEFTSAGDIDIAGGIAVSADRFWINLTSNSTDASEIKRFMALDKAQSFMATDWAEPLVRIDTDIKGWGNIGGLLNTAGLGFQERALAQVGIQTMFEDAACMTFSLDFGKDDLKASLSVTDAKGRPAKFLFDAGKVDPKTIQSVGGTADYLAALCIPKSMIEKLGSEASKGGPSLMAVYLQALSNIDGTAAFAGSVKESGAVRGVITTDGTNNTVLTQQLQAMGFTTVKEGDLLKIDRGTVSGSAEVSAMASDLKDAVAGFVFTAPEGSAAPGGLSKGVVRLVSEGPGLRLEFKGNVAGKGPNALQMLLGSK